MSEHDPKIERKVATALWSPVGSFALVLAIALVAGMASEKVDAGPLSFIGQNAYAITLFGIPLMAGVLTALSIIGRSYSSSSKHEAHWTARVPPIVEDVSRSSLRAPVTVIILLGFLLLPWATLGIANRKFFEGTYYFATDASKGCEDKTACQKIGSGRQHFHAEHGISLTNTPYRYEGNKTYIPILYPVLFIGVSAAASLFCIRYLIELLAKV